MNRTIVITGSTRGIGLGLAKEFLKRGCNVVVCGRSQVGVNKAVEQLTAEVGGANLLGVRCDVSSMEQVQALWEAGAKRFGRIDIWINNAGTTTNPLPFGQLEKDEIDATLATKILGSLYSAHVAINGMLKQGGGDIYFTEGMGGKGEIQEGVSMLGTGNAAVVYFVKALRKEYAGSNVRFHTLRPGINVTEHFLHGVEHLDEARWERSKRTINILGDTPETTTPWLADAILKNDKQAGHIAWLTPMKIMLRFMTAGFNKRDLFAGYTRPRTTDR
ncbi:MAG: SDR family oxidoreductase [Anaerolineales bacterium]